MSEGGNITCPGSPMARGNFIVTSGNKCHLYCSKGFVALNAKEATCYNGRLSDELYCVLPGAMIVVGGRSDTSGVLSSVELYHNTMFVNDTAAVTTETASDDDNNNQSSVAALNVARAGAEAVLK